VVVIAHRMPRLAAATRSLLLRTGRVQAFGPTQAVLALLQAAMQGAAAHAQS
jgi:ABC-type protease/lipase transport system fused ATPase/permease subunit